MEFDRKFFNKIEFNKKQTDNILISAKKDLLVAKNSKIIEVIFRFSYDSLLKFGMYVLAKNGYKTRSIPGHHQKIIEKTSIILNNNLFFIIGERMRRQRNFDLYECVFTVSEKEVFEYLNFVISFVNGDR